ncbi:MAG: endonuclease/exonuclease/phosphatase family protein [Bacteroidales bacterium]|jgi:endonuclease/exonuclease/phosphatase family metal-dependent hydrolase|nr:endonuclease/exonuclease/phosphatase family protein [Bacteroidales bacterium]
MKNILYIALIITVALQSCTAPVPVKLMTYNIRLDYPLTGENTWDLRKDVLIQQVISNEIDFLGIQEGMPNQVKYIDSVLINHQFIGVGRDDGKNEGEYSAIFYNKDKFKIVKQNTFWLSETPVIPSFGWDAACKRILTYALFKDKLNDQYFWVFNTHFDHVGIEARRKSAELIIEEIKNLNQENYPVILMGDFNLTDESEEIKHISSFLSDSQKLSNEENKVPMGTYNNFDISTPITRRIDFIFVSESSIKIEKYNVISETYNGKYISDHFPVCVDVIINY